MKLAAMIPGVTCEPAYRVFECTQCGRLDWLSEQEERIS